MKSLKKLAMMAIFFAVSMVALDTLAQTDDPFQAAVDTMANIFSNVRVVIYVLGAFGLIGIAVGGIITGKINWKWLGGLAMGLGIIAIADYVVTYASSGVDENSDIAEFGGFES